MGSFLVLRMILGCGLDVAVVTGGRGGGGSEAGGLEDPGTMAEGAGRFTQETTVGSTLWTGVEEASRGAFNTQTQTFILP